MPGWSKISTCAAAIGVVAWASPRAALAQEQPGSSPAAETSPAVNDLAAAARTGFQLALRTGYMAPFGQATAAPGDAMGDTFSGQVPLLVDAGWKPSPNVFLGGYLGLGVGGASGASGRVCSQASVTCVAASVRLGLEVQYQFSPASSTNPWIGYGIGIESIDVSGGTTGDADADDPPLYSVGAVGWEFAHLMAGLDWRLSRVIGVGPFVDFSLGRYDTVTVRTSGVSSSGSIEKQALHEWLLVGARAVLFP